MEIYSVEDCKRLEEICKKGEMSIQDFVDLLAFKPPYQTHLLKVGDYVVDIHYARKDILVVEKIAKLNDPCQGTFDSVPGTVKTGVISATGPINGNIFVKFNKGGMPGHFPPYALIEGERVTKKKGHVYQVVNRYLGKDKVYFSP